MVTAPTRHRWPTDDEYRRDNPAPPRDEIPMMKDDGGEVRRLIASATEPLDPTGTIDDCPACGGKDTLLTTNNLVHREATADGMVVIPRLPGAHCQACGEALLDMAAINIIEQHAGKGIHGDYLTTVSKSGNVPAILVKEDLRRVLGLKGGEKLSWKVFDADHAYVQVQRS